jgi:hypothetical protein
VRRESHDPSPQNSLLRGRIKSFALSALLGPPVAGAFWGLWGVASAIVTQPAGLTGDMASTPISLALFAIPFGIPFAVPVGLLGLWLFRSKPIMPMWSFLLVALVSTLLLAWFFWLPPAPSSASVFNRHLALDYMPFFLRDFGPIMVAALLSAAIFWRITRRWHSPEAPFNTPLQP